MNHYIIETLSNFDTEQEYENEQCNNFTTRPSNSASDYRTNIRLHIDA